MGSKVTYLLGGRTSKHIDNPASTDYPLLVLGVDFQHLDLKAGRQVFNSKPTRLLPVSCLVGTPNRKRPNTPKIIEHTPKTGKTSERGWKKGDQMLRWNTQVSMMNSLGRLNLILLGVTLSGWDNSNVVRAELSIYSTTVYMPALWYRATVCWAFVEMYGEQRGKKIV